MLAGVRRRALVLAVASGLTACALACVLAACGGSSGAARPARHRPRVSLPAQPVKFLPHGIRTLAHGAFPGGDRFALDAQHYRFQGHVYVSLGVSTPGGAGSSFTPAQTPGTIAFALFGQCSHPSVLLLYGLLRVVGDAATLSSSAGTRPLSRRSIPADLRSGGVLVFGVATTPAKLVVKAPGGKVVESFPLPRPPGCSQGGGDFAVTVARTR